MRTGPEESLQPDGDQVRLQVRDGPQAAGAGEREGALQPCQGEDQDETAPGNPEERDAGGSAGGILIIICILFGTI